MADRLDQIVWGNKIVDTKCGDTYVIRPLTLAEKQIANHIYDKAFKNGSAYGILEKSVLIKKAVDSNIWKIKYESDLLILRKELDSVRNDFKKEEEINKKRRTPTSRTHNLINRINYLVEQISKIENIQYHHIDLPSLEYYAERERGIYALACSCLNFPSLENKWKNLDEINNEENTLLISELLNILYQDNITEESEIRKISRSPTWRIKWLNSKKNRGTKGLFGKELYELTIDQFRLIYWSQIYDSAYESMEPPSDDIIDNDELFDKWLEKQNKKRKEDQKNKNTKNSKTISNDGNEIFKDVNGFFSNDCTCGIKDTNRLSRHIHAPSCPFGVYIYYDSTSKQDKVDEVQSLNSDAIRKLLANEQHKLYNNRGNEIEDQKLRDKSARLLLGYEDKKVK